MKKYLLFSIVLVLLITLSGCNSDTYDEAMGLYNNGQFQEALDEFSTIATYEDSAEMISKCKYELAKTAITEKDYETAISYLTDLNYEDSEDLLGRCENADYEFLDVLQEAITNRMATSKDASDTSSYKDIVNTELAYLDGFNDATFYDEELGNLCKEYLNALNHQKESISYETKYEQQGGWQQGMVDRFAVLNELHEKYGFMSDDKEFVATYITGYEDQIIWLDGFNAIEADIDSQLNGDIGHIDYSSGTFIVTLKNNTEYTFSTTFVFTFYVQGTDTIIQSNEYYIEDIKPGNSYQAKGYIPSSDWTVRWINYYNDIKK